MHLFEALFRQKQAVSLMEHKITPQQISNEAITPQGVTLVTAKRQKLLYGAYAHTHARERFSEFINR